jgi:hypothetical protein
MRWSSVIVVCVALLMRGAPAEAQKHPCTSAEAQRAGKVADTIRTWDGLYKSYKSYGHCDDGEIAEGFSESVARILVDHWNTLDQLSTLASKNAAFLHFVLRHVDSTLNPTDIEKIKAKASTECPSGLHTLCLDIRRQLESARKE